MRIFQLRASILLTLVVSARCLECCGESSHPAFVRHKLVSESGSTHSYAVLVPESPSSQLFPLLVFLNGVGENGEDGFRQISNNFGVQIWEMRRSCPFIVVAPQCRSGGSWAKGSDDSDAALMIIGIVCSKFPVDRNRIYLTGVSSGGCGVWTLGSSCADQFAGIVPLCGFGGDAEAIARSGVPVWSFCNGGDEPSLVASNRLNHERILALGGSSRYSEYQAGGHDCWNRAYRSANLFAWLQEQTLADPLRPVRPASLSSPVSFRQLVQAGSGVWRVDEGDLIVGDCDQPASSVALESPRAGYLEFTGELWIDAKTRCGVDISSGRAGPSYRVHLMSPAIGNCYATSAATGRPVLLSLASARSIRSGEWNAIALRVSPGGAKLFLNDCAAGQLPFPANTGPSRAFVSLVALGGHGEVKWRRVAYRGTDQGVDLR